MMKIYSCMENILINFSLFKMVFKICDVILSSIFIAQVLDLLTDVNVEFMLCPTGAMTTIFQILPRWVLWPSYRSFLTLLVAILGPLISVGFILLAKIVMWIKNLFLRNPAVHVTLPATSKQIKKNL